MSGRNKATVVRQSDRAFGLMFAAVFAFLSLITWLLSGRVPMWAFLCVATFLAAALMCPWVLLPLNRLWSEFARIIGHFNNRLILGAYFFGVMWPIGAIIRTFGSDPMHRKIDPAADTYWTKVGRQAEASTFHDQF